MLTVAVFASVLVVQKITLLIQFIVEVLNFLSSSNLLHSILVIDSRESSYLLLLVSYQFIDPIFRGISMSVILFVVVHLCNDLMNDKCF